MFSSKLRTCLAIILSVLFLLNATGSGIGLHGSWLTYVSAQNQVWREADPVRVIIDSTADWGRIVFDDFNGTNSNGLRIRSVLSSGWLSGKDDDDLIDVGHKIPWLDTEYDHIITRKGDMFGFFKGLLDFHYTEAYSDLILDVDVGIPQVYVWLMTGGNGTTTFQIVSKDTGGTIWRDIAVGGGETQQVKRMMSPQPFFRTGRTESAVVVAWLSVAILVIVILNFPIVEALKRRVQRNKTTTDYGAER